MDGWHGQTPGLNLFQACLSVSTALAQSASGGDAISTAPVNPPQPPFNKGGSRGESKDDAAKTAVLDAFRNMPLYFIENKGQMDERVKFYIKGNDHTVFFTDSGMVLNIVKGRGERPFAPTNAVRTASCGKDEENNSVARPHALRRDGGSDALRHHSIETLFKDSERQPLHYHAERGNEQMVKPASYEEDNCTTEGVALKFSFGGANAKPTGMKETKGKVNYFIGNDQKKWKTGIGTYSEVAYNDLYDGIDLIYKGEQGRLKYDLVVKPGTDVSRIRFACEGAEGLSVSDTGDLIIKTAPVSEYGTSIGEIRDKKPYCYQEIDGKKVEVEGSFVIATSCRHGMARSEDSLPVIARSDSDEAISYNFKGEIASPLARNDKKVSPQFVYGFQVAEYNKNYPLHLLRWE